MKLMTYLGLALVFSIPAKAIYVDGGIDCYPNSPSHVDAQAETGIDYWDLWDGWSGASVSLQISGPSSAYGSGYAMYPDYWAEATASVATSPAGNYQYNAWHYAYSYLFEGWYWVYSANTSCDIQASSGGDPTPNINLVTPYTWDAGQGYSVSIYGGGFGTDPELNISGTGVSAYITSSSDTLISAQVNVSPNAPDGPAYVQVISHGYNGMGFQGPPGGGGGGPGSNTTTAQIRAVLPGATIDSNWSIEDGGQTTFHVSTSGPAPTGYSWSFTSPGGGNNPNVSFGSPGSASTTTDGHWYARPDSFCFTSGHAIYDIHVAVGFPLGLVANASAQLTVSIPDTGGETDFNWNAVSLTAGPAVGQDGNGVWRVTSQGAMAIGAPITKNVYLLNSSQFYNKVFQHESKHETDLQSGYLRVVDFFAAIQNLSDSTLGGLSTKVSQAFQSFKAAELARSDADRAQLEHSAYMVSDQIAPYYFYQGCGR